MLQLLITTAKQTRLSARLFPLVAPRRSDPPSTAPSRWLVSLLARPRLRAVCRYYHEGAPAASTSEARPDQAVRGARPGYVGSSYCLPPPDTGTGLRSADFSCCLNASSTARAGVSRILRSVSFSANSDSMRAAWFFIPAFLDTTGTFCPPF